MPNWCDNDLSVTGPEAEVTEFMEWIGSGPEQPLLDFNVAVPYPEEFKGPGSPELRAAYKAQHGREPFDGYNAGGYDWCVANWGTKWNATDVLRDPPKPLAKGRVRVDYHFDTAWSPPTPVVDAMAERFPGLRFTLHGFERGMGYKIKARWEKGEQVVHEESEYSGNRGG